VHTIILMETWEFCLYYEKEQIDYILKLYKHLKRIFKKHRGVVLLVEEENEILIACNGDEKFFINIYRYIYNYIINIIYTYYKRKFLDELDCNLFNNEIFEIVIKETLFHFDEEYDKNIIRQSLLLEESLNLLGFFNFKLSSLKEKWQQLINLIKNNAEVLNSYVINLDLTRYLLKELDNNIDKVCLFSEGNKYFLKNAKGENITYKKINFSKKQNFKEILKSLVMLSPKNIILCSDIKKEELNIFKDVFYDKL